MRCVEQSNKWTILNTQVYHVYKVGTSGLKEEEEVKKRLIPNQVPAEVFKRRACV